MRTRSQIWSQIAFKRVSRVKQDKTSAANYNTSCNKMPGLIHQSGALQALVFQMARNEAGKQYVDDLAAAYWAEDKEASGKTGTGKKDSERAHARLIADIQTMPLKQYMAFTRDLAEIAQWFRRFAQIELKDLGTEDTVQ